MRRRYCICPFAVCPACQRIYWKGSHYEHMLALIDQLMREAGCQGTLPDSDTR